MEITNNVFIDLILYNCQLYESLKGYIPHILAHNFDLTIFVKYTQQKKK